MDINLNHALRLSILYAMYDAYVNTERMAQDEWASDLSIKEIANTRMQEVVYRTMGMASQNINKTSVDMVILPVANAIALSILSEDLLPLMEQRIAMTPELQELGETIKRNWPDDEFDQDSIMWMSNSDLKQLIEGWAKNKVS